MGNLIFIKEEGNTTEMYLSIPINNEEDINNLVFNLMENGMIPIEEEQRYIKLLKDGGSLFFNNGRVSGIRPNN